MDNVNIAHFKSITETKEAISWILERQSELRSELLTFYKKDFKEIQSALGTLGTGGVDAITKKALETVERHFIDQWQRSYDLITPCRLNRVNGGAKLYPISRLENVNNNSDTKTSTEANKS
jgi:hypothetical protein